jgi:AraC-like DNA-binding protein
MQVTTPKGRWLVPSDRAVWLPPRLAHAVDALTDIAMRTLYVDPRWLAAHPDRAGLSREFVVSVAPLLREAILASCRPGLTAARATRLVEVALSELAEAEDAATFVPLPTDARALRAAKQVLDDPAGDASLDILAHAAGTSARTLTRLFSAETGMPFKEWRQRARIMSALPLLASKRASIKRIAAQLGFSSVAAFSHAFRQVMGQRPSDVAERD